MSITICPYCKNEFDPNYLNTHIILYCNKKDKKTTLKHKEIILLNIKNKFPDFSEKNISKTNLQLAKIWTDSNKRLNLMSQLKKKYPKNKLCFISDKKIYDLDEVNFSLEYSKNYAKILDLDIKLNLYTHLYSITIGKKIYTTINKPNKGLILKINTQKEEDICNKKYELYKNFSKIKKYFGGIEFNLNGKKMKKNHGCIWNNDIIKNLQLIGTKHRGYNKEWNIL